MGLIFLDWQDNDIFTKNNVHNSFIFYIYKFYKTNYCFYSKYILLLFSTQPKAILPPRARYHMHIVQ